MHSWSSPSPEPGTARAWADASGHAQMLRRFVEASRRAEIVALVNSAGSEAELGEAITAELCEAFEAEVAFIVAERSSGVPPELVGSTGLSGEQRGCLLRDPLVIGAIGATGEQHAGPDLLGVGARRLALEQLEMPGGGRGVLGVARLYDDELEPAETALLRAVATSVSHALERFWLGAERARHALGQTALLRAARSLNSSLDRDLVLETLCREVAGAMDADVVNVYFGRPGEDLVAVWSYGLAEEFKGFRRRAGEGLAGQAVRTGRPQMSNAYSAEGHAPRSTAALRDVCSAISVPMQRHGGVDGALSVGFRNQRWIDQADVELVEAFAELASAACRNAEEHADMRRAAMVDALTGCLNHGAFQTLLREEITRAERGLRAGRSEVLSLVLADLHDFKSVNEDHGHPAGDDLLRAVGAQLRDVLRPYDHVARYGGDEFALLLPGTSRAGAQAVVQRARAALAEILRPDGRPLKMSAGVVEWRPGEHAPELLDRVDRGLRASKVQLRRGAGSGIEARLPGPGDVEPDARRSLRVALAGRIGARLAGELDTARIGAIVTSELQAAIGGEHCRLVRLDEDGHVVAVAAARADGPGPALARRRPQDEGAIGRCLRERRAVVVGPQGPLSGGRARWEVAVPLAAGPELWGAVHVHTLGTHALACEDADFVEAVGDHLSAALHTAELYRRLDEAYLGTAQALAAALEAKDDYTADHARSIADLATAVGRRLDLDESHLRDLRYAAIFHDIGKIAIPDAILNKPGPLTDEEFDLIKRHPEAGEQILAPVPFLARVRRIVRHDHERWDGTGYPDGLRGPEIPIGARVVFVVDAYHAMVSDRPYRRAMPQEEAREELVRCAGSQFDPTVVAAFLDVLERGCTG